MSQISKSLTKYGKTIDSKIWLRMQQPKFIRKIVHKITADSLHLARTMPNTSS
jgi:hypothetical protein